MSMFAETAILNYWISFADLKSKLPFSVSVCRQQMKVCRISLPSAANKLKLLFSIYTALYIRTYSTHTRKTELFICCHFKLKMEGQAIFLNPFIVAHHANSSLSFVRFETNRS
jgi:hypothetical protein